MSANLLVELKTMFEEHAAKLPGVTQLRMFGCDGFFKEGTIFGLIWKTGRIGVKLPDEKAYDELMGMPGAAPWAPSEKMAMTAWVLVPESFHDDEAALDAWIQRAHAMAVPKSAKPSKKAKAPAAKKAAAAPKAKTKTKTKTKTKRSAKKRR